MKFKIECILTVIITSVFLFFIIDFIENVPNPNIGTGKIVPTTPPNESNRIFSPDGYSMISPEGWRTTVSKARTLSAPSQMYFTALKIINQQSIRISIYRSPLEEQSINSFLNDEYAPKITEIEFNGHPAYWYSNYMVNNAYNLDIAFEENGYYWEFTLRYRGPHDNKVHEIYWDYIKTFRSDPAEANKTDKII